MRAADGQRFKLLAIALPMLVLRRALAVLLPVLLFASRGAAREGIVVDAVAGGGAAERAGLKAGDVLLAWSVVGKRPSRETAGVFVSFIDAQEAETNRAVRGPLRVEGRRVGAPLAVTIPLGDWRLTARPDLPAAALAEWEAARRLAREGDAAAGWAALRAARDAARGSPEAALWFGLRFGEALAEGKKAAEARAAFREARERVGAGASAAVRAHVAESEARSVERLGEVYEAEVLYREALEARRREDKASLAVARQWEMLARSLYERGDLPGAGDAWRASLALRKKRAPRSAAEATSLNGLGKVRLAQGEAAEAERLLLGAVALRERLVPDSSELASSLGNLGLLARRRGDLARAEELYRRDLAIAERVAPGTTDVAWPLNYLGILAKERGDLHAADDLFGRALALFEAEAPGGVSVAGGLDNLGLVAMLRGDLVAAGELHEKALAIRSRLAPESLDVAASLSNLGTVMLRRGDLDAARRFNERALVLREKLAPAHPDTGRSRMNLGEIARQGGDSAEAERLFEEAREFHEEISPGGLEVAECLEALGELAVVRGRPGEAEEHLREALAIRRRLAPGSSGEAESWHELGLLLWKMQRPGEAASAFRSALAAIETQSARLGSGDPLQAGFAPLLDPYYRDLIGLLADLGQPEEAFHVLERSLARGLRALLARRDLVFAADVPARLLSEKRRLAWAYDEAQAEIARLSTGRDAARLEELLRRLHSLHEEQGRLADRISRASPRFASLQYPKPLDLPAAKKSLDPGTVLLSYCVMKEKTLLFVVSTGSFRAFTLPVGAEALGSSVNLFRSLLLRGREEREPGAALLSAGRRLFDTLVAPAAAEVEASSRVLVSPDGPLLGLPFAALVKTGKSGPLFLAEWKPTHHALSATVYAQVRARPFRRAFPLSLAAFGDPRTPARTVAETAGMHPAMRYHAGLPPLPAARDEVEGIAAVFGPLASTYIGEQATEEALKAVAASARYLHFACHALLDRRFPLDSGLALAPSADGSGRENGLLQAWEIFERVRLDADLVTLSACETGLGGEGAGEGLIGLTQAFQYAGARSVLASLWKVSDRSTTVLMKAFYGHLRAGRPKDEALQTAQLDLLRGDFPHPYHWAAFELIGGWR
jgi:CHAT domain-containing protein/tetratricopeptide (TPR) repeat protein